MAACTQQLPYIPVYKGFRAEWPGGALTTACPLLTTRSRSGHARTIQRFWRGCRGRRRFAAAREEKDRALRQVGAWLLRPCAAAVCWQ